MSCRSFKTGFEQKHTKDTKVRKRIARLNLPLLELCLWGYCLLTVLCAGAVTYRYRSLFNPLLYPSLQLLVMAGLAPLIHDVAHSKQLDQDWWIEASLTTSLYLFGLTWPFFTPLNPLLPVCELLLGPCELARRRTGDRSRRSPQMLCLLYFGGLIVLAGVLYYQLLQESPVGLLWLINPRMAYLGGRAGNGHWYVLSQTCLFLAYLGWLYYGRVRDRFVLLAGTVVFLWAFSYFGSKAAMVGVIMAGGIYFNYFVRTFTWGEVAVAAGLGVPMVLISPWLQGNFESLKETLQYYDYFDNAARYVGRSENFGPNYGGTLLSSLWEYVPRRVWPTKPFVYGSIVVNEHFFPGAAEVGYTPGYLPWIPYHLDFGATGVAVGASIFGFLNKAIYTYFLRHRSFLGFLCYLQVAFIPVLKLAPVLYFVGMLVMLALSLRVFVLVGNILLNQDHSQQTAPRGPGARRSGVDSEEF